MGRSRFLVPFLIWALVATTPALPADARQRRAHVTDLQVARSGDRLQVSYRIEAGFSEELAEKIEAGIPVSFRHRAEVTTRHWLPLWPRGTVASATVETTVKYDSLTHRYELSRVVEMSSRGKRKSPPQTRRESTVHESEARAWMTEIHAFPPLDLSTLPVDVTARVRVESALGRKWIVLVPTRRIVSKDYKLEPAP